MLTCRFVRAQPVDLPPWLVDEGVAAVADIYRSASHGAIDLDIDTVDLEAPMFDTTADLASYDLHDALRSFLGTGTQPLDTVGVLLARRYKPRRIFGIMFDTEFARYTDAKTARIAGLPREGCAVFLDEIARQRRDVTDAEAQAFFTTIHELGHVFNLPHFNSDPCYMCESGTVTYGSAYFRFIDHQKLHLSLADPNQAYVWPGGSPFGARRNYDGVDAVPSRRRSPVELSLSIARRHFNHFEPVELDIEVALGKDRERAVRIPDTIDPGYERFRIWIEEPNGERRLYRSPRHYCWSGGMLEIARGTPFRRDISVFGESGGFTFRRRGVHRVWAELDVPSCAVTTSNAIEFEIDPIRSASAARDARLFSTPSVRTVLYHRLDRHRGTGMRLLQGWLSRQRGHAAAPSVRYAIARAMLEKAGRAKGARARELTKDSRRLLRTAVDSDMLGSNQRCVAERVLETDVFV